MSAVTLPSEPGPAGPSPSAPASLGGGLARMAFVHKDGATRLHHLDQRAPLRVLFPTPPQDDCAAAALVTTSGGVVAGDRLEVDIAVGAGAALQVTAQAAEKIYRSAGGALATLAIALTAAENAWAEYLPQETILFEGAALRRHTRIDAAAGATVLAGEMLVFGRLARGERMTRGLVRETWEVRRAGRLAWADRLHLEGDIAAHLAAPAGFAGAHAAATLVLVADDPAPHLAPLRADLARFAAETGERAAATVVNGILLARWLCRDPARMRQSFGAAWTGLRAAAGGWPARLPRLWDI
jgi:urease accessory protein